jgi:hypothetical protein
VFLRLSFVGKLVVPSCEFAPFQEQKLLKQDSHLQFINGLSLPFLILDHQCNSSRTKARYFKSFSLRRVEMCLYDLPVCPHPHQEHVVNLIYSPVSQAEWQSCDLPSPWGKLSCGNLTIAHPSFGVAQKCVWCTLALHTSISKFKTRQEEFKTKLKDIEQVMAGDAALAKLDAEISAKETELEQLRKAAWEKRNDVLKDA